MEGDGEEKVGQGLSEAALHAAAASSMAAAQASATAKSNKKTLTPLDRPPFEVRPMHTNPPHDYRSETDPYTPFTRTSKFKKHMEGLKAGTTLATSKSTSMMEQFSSSMLSLERRYPAEREEYPKLQIQNTSLPTGGVTFSNEPAKNAEESKCEMDILKAVLNREGYLNRMERMVRTVLKKFKPEIADVMDLVRAASIEVIECIVKWREVKKDHDAAFMWNKTNYVLKMASDLDYLDEYLAVRKWMGFSLVRNPFCVPYAMEEGAGMFADRVLNPKHIEPGQQADGFMIGGISGSRLRSKYTPLATPSSGMAGLGATRGESRNTSSRGASRERSSSPSKAAAPSPYAPPPGFVSEKSTTSGDGFLSSKGSSSSGAGGLPSSFVLNSDMMKIRQAELVILKEEEKFGRFARDPSGRLVSAVQAYTRLATLELRRDDNRPIDEPSESITFAPHAVNSDIGVVEEPWVPREKGTDRFQNNPLLRQIDDDARAIDRGGMSGGILVPITTQGTPTRPRRPLRINIGSAIEFNRHRKKKSLGDRLSEITQLRDEIKKQKDFLDNERRKIKRAISTSKRERRTGGMGSTTSASGGAAANMSMGLGATSPPPSRAGLQVSRGSVSFDLGAMDNMSASASTAADEEKELQGVSGNEDVPFTPSEDDAAKNEAMLDKIREREKKLLQSLEKLNEESSALQRDLDHINKDEKKTLQIKEQERQLIGSERSRDIERKRRLLSEEEGARKGPPPLENRNTYDYYATKCQSTIRGWLVRCYTRWYREASRKASTCIQACIRGKLARLRVVKIRRRAYAATGIQKVFRAFRARKVSARLASNKKLGKSAVRVQKVYRGMRGRQRAESKRRLDKAAEIAKESVNPKAVYTTDVLELARRIQYAIEEPETTSYPPDEVLHLLRISLVILQQSRGELGFSEYTFINARNYYEVDGEKMTWEQGVKLLNRAERLLKMMRTLAFGPAMKPPRIVQFSASSKLLLAGISASPNWNRKTFEEMGMGSKFCIQLFEWLEGVGEVAIRQGEFLGYLASSFPDWLPQLYDIQREKRAAEFDTAYHERIIATLEDFKRRSADDMRIIKLVNKSIADSEFEKNKASDKFAAFHTKELELAKSQSSREELALVGLEIKLENCKKELLELKQQYTMMMVSNNTLMKEKAPQTREEMINMELVVKELSVQIRLLEGQVKNNGNMRMEKNPLDVDLRVKCLAAGEAKALEVLSDHKYAVYLEDCGVRNPDQLKKEHQLQFDVVAANRSKAHDDSYNAYRQADEARKKFDGTFAEKVRLAQARDISSKDDVKPSDEELEEERREDEKMAQEERVKKMQFIPDAALFHAHAKRPRPVVIALGRDLPGQAKTRIMQEITKKMPGVFVYLDHPKNMGLSVEAMQTVLDSGKSIIMMVDHGLCRVTRMGFLKSFEMTARALIPNPFIVMAVGDDNNRRSSSGAGHFGAFKQDLQGMRDCDIKTALEGMSWVQSEFLKQDIGNKMIELAAATVPPSMAFVAVIEGFFIMQAQSEAFRTPDANLQAMSWRFTQRMLAEPRLLVDKLRKHVRGSTNARLVQCLGKYMENPLWPAPNSTARTGDVLLHLFALYVECFAASEGATLERGGVPPNAMSRASMKGIQSVEVVSDAYDPEDLIYSQSGGGWRMTAAKLIRVALQDLRTLKSVLRVDDKLLNVCAYREGDFIYLDTYDPATSETHVCSVKLHEVAVLLMPNSSMLEKDGRLGPPQTAAEMYAALAKRLRMEPYLKSRADSRRRLVCRRDLTFLRQTNLKLNGHAAFIKCFEAALGQLTFQAYLPEYSAIVSFTLGPNERSRLIDDADPRYEYDAIIDNDSRKILPYAIDRLRIAPNNTMTRVAREGPDLQRGYRKKQGKLSMIKAQGFSISVRQRGGCGKILRRRIASFSGVPHIVEARVLSMLKLLIVKAYEPRSRSTMKVTMKPYYRRLLLGSDSEDSRAWMPQLTKRLKIDWRGKHDLSVDLTILRVVRKIANERLILSLQLAKADDETSTGGTLKVEVLNPMLSEKFAAELSKEQVIRLLLYAPPLDQIEKQFGVKVGKPAVRNILKNAKTTRPATNSGGSAADGGEEEEDEDEGNRSTASPGSVKSSKAGSKGSSKKKGASSETAGQSSSSSASSSAEQQELHPSTFDVTLESVLSKHDNLVKLANQLSIVLQLIDPASNLLGYRCHQPFPFDVLPPERVKEKMTFDTKARFEPRLKQAERVPTVDGVIRSRRQMPIIMMEEELNLLAQAKAEAAQKALDDIIAAGKELEQHFLGLSEADYNKMAGVPVDGEDNTVSASLPERDREDALESLIEEAASLTTDTLVSTLEDRENRREVERAAPGTTQEVRRLSLLSGAGDGRQVIEIEAHLLNEEEKEILGRGEIKVFDGGVKTQFRDLRAVWSGHVSIKVYETMCWQGSEGVGRRLRFDIYEPSSSSYYEGLIRNNRHLKQIVGRHGYDLIAKNRTTELIMFIAKFKMFITDNSITWDGVKNEPGAPAFRVEFDVQRIFTDDKITPINANTADDEAANKDKLFESDAAAAEKERLNEAEVKRGRKICRLVRRISNLLIQLTIFEIASSAEDLEAVALSPYGQDPLEGVSAEELEMMAMAKGGEVGGTRPVNLGALGQGAAGGEGKAETREVTKLKRHKPPTLRVVAYEPRSKKKIIYVASPLAVLEISGGVYSPFLDPEKRRELAKIVADALVLHFPKGKPMELNMNWSGAAKEAIATVVAEKKVKTSIQRSSAETVLKKGGKLFRAACRVGRLDCLVTLYQQDLPKSSVGDTKGPTKQLVVNLYSRGASDATEIVVSEEDQEIRLGRQVSEFAEGEVRAAAVRRFLRFVLADLIDDPSDPDNPRPAKILHAVLRPPGKDFLTEYHSVRPGVPGESIRPVGCPTVFMPPNTCGRMLHRRGMNLTKRANPAEDDEFLVSVYTINDDVKSPDRGLVIKIYEKATSEVAVLHLGQVEIARLATEAGEPDLLRDIANALAEIDRIKLDVTEEPFDYLTERGDAGLNAKRLIDLLVGICLQDLGIDRSPTDHLVPFLKSKARGYQIDMR